MLSELRSLVAGCGGGRQHACLRELADYPRQALAGCVLGCEGVRAPCRGPVRVSSPLPPPSSLQLAKTQGNVFATDAILATLMGCTRSVYSWDIVVQRVGSKLFFDKRDNSDFGRKPVWEQHKGVGCLIGSEQVPGSREWAGNRLSPHSTDSRGQGTSSRPQYCASECYFFGM